MPRRLPVRPAKIIGNIFVLFGLGVIGTLYYTYVFIVWGPKCISNIIILNTVDNFPVMLLLTFFHVFFILLVWSFFQAMTTDPGQVPVFWVSIILMYKFRVFTWVTMRTNEEGTV